jgi:hypothetical protein
MKRLSWTVRITYGAPLEGVEQCICFTIDKAIRLANALSTDYPASLVDIVAGNAALTLPQAAVAGVPA